MAKLLANVFGTSPVQPLEEHMDVVSRVDTIPAGASLAIVFFFLFKVLLP